MNDHLFEATQLYEFFYSLTQKGMPHFDPLTRQKVENAGFKVMTPSESASWADIIMMLTPDELQSDIYNNDISNNIKEGTAIAFAHGLNIHFDLIQPSDLTSDNPDVTQIISMNIFELLTDELYQYINKGE